MSANTDTEKMTLVRVDLQKKLAVLGTTFQATLDKKTYFPKRISLYCQVKEPAILRRLLDTPTGSEIIATITSDLQKSVNYLDDFTVAS